MTIQHGFENQTNVINEVERIRISRECPENHIMTEFFPDMEKQTLHCLFQRGLNISRHKPCLGSRKPPSAPAESPSSPSPGEDGATSNEYQWKTYDEVNKLSQMVGSALIHSGHCPRKEEKIGVYGTNRWEWDVTQMACNSFSMVTVPLYDTLGMEAISHIVSVTEMTTVVCDNEDKLNKLLKCHDQCPNLSLVVVMDHLSSEVTAQAKLEGIKVTTFQKFLETGRSNMHAFVPPLDADALALILFTSGTTGMPKGVMLTNRNVVADVGAMLEHYKVQCLDNTLSFQVIRPTN
ncbi:long-chain-fatty-acid--CoA ligase 1-like [Convolutriloba macropyga]|uniref:long-chain-fatty-acid--CoA ligase 1-like n=1 Tax=Convolutriloba macropyga TaxID=536237 RepID=UPI003F524F07